MGVLRLLQLTRQNEDLRETKERMRAEIEGVNKQMDRKQKLLTGTSNPCTHLLRFDSTA